MGRKSDFDLTIVLPCLNEEQVIAQTLKRIFDVLSGPLAGLKSEILIVDDGSSDNTVEVALASDPPRNSTIRILRLSRNFGHQVAISAGIRESLGEAVAILDADLQDPPELLPRLLEKLNDGYDVVSGKRISRDGVAFWKRSSYSLFYRLWKGLSSDLDIPLDTGDFRVLSRRAVHALVDLPEKKRFVRGLLPYLGLPHASIEYERSARAAGSAKYTLPKLVQLALDGLFSFSTKPLRVALYFGVALFVLAGIGAGFVVADRLLSEDWAPGWAGTLVVVLAFGGLQFLFLGIIGEYVGKIFEEVKNRPAYIVLEELKR